MDHGIVSSVAEVGVEPTITRLSTPSSCLFGYPAMLKLQILESNQASNLMRVGRAPAHLQNESSIAKARVELAMPKSGTTF